MDLSNIKPSLEIDDVDLASKYSGPTDVAYTEDQISELTGEEIDQFAELFGFDPTQHDDETNRERILRILYFLNLISGYQQILVDQNVIESMCQQMSVNELNNYRVANGLIELNCRVYIDDPDQQIHSLEKLNNQTGTLGILIEEHGSNQVMLKAIENKKYEIIKIMLKSGFKVSDDDETKRSILLSSLQLPTPDIFCTLLEQGADPNIQNSNGVPILNIAVQKSLYEMTECLLENGADTESTDQIDQTALVVAAYKDDLKMVKLLTRHGADVNHVPNNAVISHPLGAAAIKGNLDIISYLLDHGAHIETFSALGVTPLMSASFLGETEAVKLLLRRGANKNVVSPGGLTALGLATMGMRFNVINVLHEGDPTFVSRVASWFGRSPDTGSDLFEDEFGLD